MYSTGGRGRLTSSLRSVFSVMQSWNCGKESGSQATVDQLESDLAARIDRSILRAFDHAEPQDLPTFIANRIDARLIVEWDR